MPHEVLPDDGRPASTSASSSQCKQSSHSVYARTALMSSKLALSVKEHNGTLVATDEAMLPPPPPMMPNGVNGLDCLAELKPVPGRQSARHGVGIAASDTPLPSAPSSPRLSVNFSLPLRAMPDAYSCPEPPRRIREPPHLAYDPPRSIFPASPSRKCPRTVASPSEMSVPSS